MNIRLQKYKKNRLLGMNQLNAAIAAGYSYNYASRRSYKLENVVNLKDAFERAGLTDKAIVNHALKGLQANKLQGEALVETEDWNVRHKYFESISKLTDRIKEISHQTNVQVNVMPTKTLVFRDYENTIAETTRDSGSVYEPESATGSSVTSEIQST